MGNRSFPLYGGLSAWLDSNRRVSASGVAAGKAKVLTDHLSPADEAPAFFPPHGVLVTERELTDDEALLFSLQ